MSFFEPVFSILQWAVLGVVPLLIFLLYFLKLKRQPLEVPSTYLWARTLEDLHVNSLWQRLRNSLLLWLQLLLVLLLLLSGLRPGCPGDQLEGERFIFLVDNSASMAATDGDKTRLELAKERVADLIEAMKPGDAAMLISFNDQAFTQQSYTKNKSLLKRKLEAIQQSQRRTDLREALIAASGLADPGRTSNREDNRDYQVAEAREAKLFMLSDGGVSDVPEVSMKGLTPEYIAVGSAETPDNLGIAAFSVSLESEETDSTQAYARIENFSDQDQSVGVTLYTNGELYDSQDNIEVKANGATGLSFDLAAALEQYPMPIKLRLEIERKDDLAIDNEAFAILNKPRQARILVLTEGNRFLRFGMVTEQNSKIAMFEFELPSFMETEDYRAAVAAGAYDLIVFDRCAPSEDPLSNTFYIDSLPPGDRWKVSEPFDQIGILDYSRSHPITQFLVIQNVLIIQARMVTESPTGSISLIDSTQGPLLVVGPRDGFQDLVLAMPIVQVGEDGTDQLNTDWPRDLSFPLMMQNIVSYLGGNYKVETDQSAQTGEIIRLKVSELCENIKVKRPSGQTASLRRNANNLFVYSETGETGIYDITIEDEEEPREAFAVNLIDGRESNLRVRDSLEIGFEEIEKSENKTQVRREWWKWIVALAVIVLLTEWLIYNRRVFM